MSEIVRGFKTFSSREINASSVGHGFRWQKTFYDHIIRDEESLGLIRQYIHDNPFRWGGDGDDEENIYFM